MNSDAYRKRQRERPRPIIKRISDKIGKMMRDGSLESDSVKANTVFVDNDDARQHFRSTFEAWMNWSNYGANVADSEYNQRWNVGHRIPRALYDPRSPEDIRRSLSKQNLFAQCAKKNNEDLQHGLLLSDSALLSLRCVWPIRFTSLHQLKMQLSAARVSESESESEFEGVFE